MAQELLDSGAARKKLDEFIQESGGPGKRAVGGLYGYDTK